MALSEILRSWLLDGISKQIKKTEERIMGAIDELATEVANMKVEITALTAAFDNEVTQSTQIVAGVNKLLALVGEDPRLAGIVADLKASIGTLQSERTRLASDNAAVQAAIDAANQA